MGWYNATVHLGDHVCVWVQFIIQCTLDKRYGGHRAPMRMKQALLILMLFLFFLGIPLPKIQEGNDLTYSLQ